MSSRKKFSITTLTLVALVLGIVVGIVVHGMPSSYVKDTVLVDGVFYVVGNGFMRLLKMVVVPLVFTSLVTGTMAMGDVKKVGRIGVKTVCFYILTTALAIAIALTLANILDPGVGMDMSTFQDVGEVTVAESEPFSETLLNMIPDNPISSMAEGDMIPIIVFAIFVGIAISMVSENMSMSVVSEFFLEFNEVMMKITLMILSFAPYGVFCLVARTFATMGTDALTGLIKYFFTVVLGLIIQVVVVYSLILFVTTGLSPIKFFKKMSTVIIYAFSTSSSNATIPTNIETLEHKMGVPRRISSFTIPLGATINMDGTAIMQGVAVVFTAQAFGITLTPADYFTVITTATLASIGTAGVPGVGLIMLSMVFTSIGLPVEAIGILMGVDRLLDMMRTCVNISGDAMVTTIMAVQEKELDKDVFNA